MAMWQRTSFVYCIVVPAYFGGIMTCLLALCLQMLPLPLGIGALYISSESFNSAVILVVHFAYL